MVGRSNLMNTVEVELDQQAQQAAVDLGDARAAAGAGRDRPAADHPAARRPLRLAGGPVDGPVAARPAPGRARRRPVRPAAGRGPAARPGAVDAACRRTSVAQQIAEPLPVRSKDEFGQVTEAFNAVHLEAVRTAAEQAALRASVATMFVNLARRSQILVDRLIGHLDRLERGEQDPDRLSELFQLDHLATRMRRNDENLLVLAGADSDPHPARAGRAHGRAPRRPVRGRALHPDRVRHHRPGHRDRRARGQRPGAPRRRAVRQRHRVLAAGHRRSWSRPAGSATGRVLQVEDRGIGMSPDQYAELNERLATPPMVDVAVSRMMGLVVVARLAARHGVKVELRPAPERGTVADVLLPSGVLVPRALAGRTPGAGRLPGRPARRPMPPRGAPASRRRWRWRAGRQPAGVAPFEAARSGSAGPGLAGGRHRPAAGGMEHRRTARRRPPRGPPPAGRPRSAASAAHRPRAPAVRLRRTSASGLVGLRRATARPTGRSAIGPRCGALGRVRLRPGWIRHQRKPLAARLVRPDRRQPAAGRRAGHRRRRRLDPLPQRRPGPGARRARGSADSAAGAARRMRPATRALVGGPAPAGPPGVRRPRRPDGRLRRRRHCAFRRAARGPAVGLPTAGRGAAARCGRRWRPTPGRGAGRGAGAYRRACPRRWT